MAINSGFFDASYDAHTGIYDRQYFSDDMSNFFNAITGNGVFKNEGDALEVIASGAGMSVTVGVGFATALGRYINNTEPYTIQIDGADSQARIDLIVARLSTLQNERNFTLIVKKGTPSLTPVAPSLTRNDAVYELCLAKVNIPNGAVSIISSMIEDTREDEELCGFVSGLGGGAEFTDCTVNDEADVYSSTWLLDKDGNEFQPEGKKVYRVITDGKYKNCLYMFNDTTNLYEGVGSYSIELTAQEALSLWDSSPYSRLSNIPAPTGDVQYTGQSISPTWLYYDPTKLRIGGTTSGINVGVYNASFEPINGYAWPDGTTDVKYISWSIVKKVVPIPIPVQTMFNYDGTAKSLTFNNLDTASVTITNGSATNTGSYAATAVLNNPSNTIWSDGTSAQKAYEFRIIGGQNIVTLSKTSVSFSQSTDTDTVTVSSSSGGTIHVESTDDNIVQASVNNSTITLTPGSSLLRGTASIIVTVDANSTYEAGTAIINVSKNYGVSIVSWANGTDAEIVGMVEAADRGEIDLHDYWHVGDERVVHISAINASGTNSFGSWNVNESHIEQDITLVLMDTGHFNLATSVLDINKQPRYKCSFVVGVKNTLLKEGIIKRTKDNANVVHWSETDRKTWCSTAFAGSIPQSLISMFKEFVVGYYYHGSASFDNELFSLFAEGEINGTSSGYSYANERNVLSQIEYYKTAANRIKKDGDVGSAVNYWTRSVAYTNENDSYVYIDTNGGGNKGKYIYSNWLAPFGCI